MRQPPAWSIWTGTREIGMGSRVILKKGSFTKRAVVIIGWMMAEWFLNDEVSGRSVRLRSGRPGGGLKRYIRCLVRMSARLFFAPWVKFAGVWRRWEMRTTRFVPIQCWREASMSLHLCRLYIELLLAWLADQSRMEFYTYPWSVCFTNICEGWRMEEMGTPIGVWCIKYLRVTSAIGAIKESMVWKNGKLITFDCHPASIYTYIDERLVWCAHLPLYTI